jgi:uncharacterized membrane protein YbhN (UPF0104 family)
MLGSVGKWVLDYLALLTALAAVGAHPRPSLVLLAYLSGAILVTPATSRVAPWSPDRRHPMAP